MSMNRSRKLMILAPLGLVLLPACSTWQNLWSKPTPPAVTEPPPVPQQTAVPVYTLPPPAAPPSTPGPKGQPYRFADSASVDISPLSHGQWSQWDEGRERWRLDLYSQGAKSLNLHFDQFGLPAGAELKLYPPMEPGTAQTLTAADNKPHKQFWTPQYAGDRLRLDLILPTALRRQVELHLATVNIAFR